MKVRSEVADEQSVKEGLPKMARGARLLLLISGRVRTALSERPGAGKFAVARDATPPRSDGGAKSKLSGGTHKIVSARGTGMLLAFHGGAGPGRRVAI